MPCQREENFAKRKLNNINGCGEKSGHLKQNRSFAAKKDDATTLPFPFVFLTFSTTTNHTERTKNVKRVHKSPDFIGGFRWTSPGCSASSKLSPLRNSGQSSRRRRASGALHFSASQSSVLLFRVPLSYKIIPLMKSSIITSTRITTKTGTTTSSERLSAAYSPLHFDNDGM